MIEAHDEPVATATWLSHYVLCGEVAADGFGTLFGGLGGDELNAGEYEYFFFRFADLRAAGRDERARRTRSTAWVAPPRPPDLPQERAASMEAGLARLVDLGAPGPHPARPRRASSATARALDAGRASTSTRSSR